MLYMDSDQLATAERLLEPLAINSASTSPEKTVEVAKALDALACVYYRKGKLPVAATTERLALRIQNNMQVSNELMLASVNVHLSLILAKAGKFE